MRSILKEDLVKQLKRFARHGGPDLRDIRGVSESCHAIENHANKVAHVLVLGSIPQSRPNQ